ncbi:DNA-binding response regulator [Corynebacterium yudongzhengii]|uniref:DNA-binding response regulator n=1 Tax=Corynebacterium yudongzhengii TaxID=2080740 RepID=A0A2U1T4M9_9CORY|nr:response regulator transcription factor [Corynebacterium yudongzhengii]AWB82700.1 DNA-binding response regulator [Corynebacterium yudongzhengii]PWC00943.1 DNA-binding response regulator [Corynebacterium yudongzhengii]
MIRIALCEDEALIASSLATLLSLEDDLDIAVVTGSGEELIAWWRKALATDNPRADIVVMDLHLGGLDGIATTEQLLELDEDVQVLVVTSHARPRALKRALAAGAKGFLTKTSSAEEFASAIRTVHAGRRHIDADLAAQVISAGESPLTEREAEVLEAAGTGSSVDDIAAKVHLAPGTTRNYLSSAMGKVGAANRFEAFQRARELGWI